MSDVNPDLSQPVQVRRSFTLGCGGMIKLALATAFMLLIVRVNLINSAHFDYSMTKVQAAYIDKHILGDYDYTGTSLEHLAQEADNKLGWMDETIISAVMANIGQNAHENIPIVVNTRSHSRVAIDHIDSVAQAIQNNEEPYIAPHIIDTIESAVVRVYVDIGDGTSAQGSGNIIESTNSQGDKQYWLITNAHVATDDNNNERAPTATAINRDGKQLTAHLAAYNCYGGDSIEDSHKVTNQMDAAIYYLECYTPDFALAFALEGLLQEAQKPDQFLVGTGIVSGYGNGYLDTKIVTFVDESKYTNEVVTTQTFDPANTEIEAAIPGDSGGFAYIIPDDGLSAEPVGLTFSSSDDLQQGVEHSGAMVSLKPVINKLQQLVLVFDGKRTDEVVIGIQTTADGCNSDQNTWVDPASIDLQTITPEVEEPQR